LNLLADDRCYSRAGADHRDRQPVKVNPKLIEAVLVIGCCPIIFTCLSIIKSQGIIGNPLCLTGAEIPQDPGTPYNARSGPASMSKILPYALIGVIGLAIAGFLRQRRRPIPTPPPLAFLFENPLVEAFAGSELLVERLGLAPGMRVLDAGCGPGRLTIPLAKAVEPTGEVVALDSQRAMLELLEHRLAAENITNVRTLEAGLGEWALEREAFDRVLLAFVLGEVRDREAAARELYAALKPGGILSVTEGFGDPDYRRPASVWREVEPAGFELVERFGGFPVYTLNFRRPENLAT
jgi:SAM-dependent methyltransferase